MDVKTFKIDDIGLSVRSANALHRTGVHTVGDLLGYTEDTLSNIRNMGRKSIDEVLLKIDEYRKYDAEGGIPETDGNEVLTPPELPESYSEFINSDEGKESLQDVSERQSYI